MSVFIAISVVDTFALENQFERLIKVAVIKSVRNFLFGCKIMQWIWTTSQICSSYFVLLFTIERFISVRFPLKRAIICTKRRINVAIVGIVVIAAVATVYELHYLYILYPRKICCNVVLLCACCIKICTNFEALYCLGLMERFLLLLLY